MFSFTDHIVTNSAYTCEATINSGGDFRNVTLINGQHLGGMNPSLVKVLSFRNQYMRQFLLRLETFFPNLEVIIAENVRLEEISGDILGKFPNLRQVNFNQNLIEAVDRALFAENRPLRVINLSLNPIRHVAQNIFENLPELRWLNMENTACISLNIVDDRNMLLNSVLRIIQSCPASSDMIEDEILGSEAFEENVRQIARQEVEEGLKPLETAVTSLIDILGELSNKVDDKAEDIEKIKKKIKSIFAKLDSIEERLKKLEAEDSSGSGSGSGSGSDDDSDFFFS